MRNPLASRFKWIHLPSVTPSVKSANSRSLLGPFYLTESNLIHCFALRIYNNFIDILCFLLLKFLFYK
jgi:hypothetical protein